MKRKKFLLMLTLMLVFVFVLGLVACTDYVHEDEPEQDEQTTDSYDQLIKNGTFYSATSTNKNGIYDTVDNWTSTSAALTVPSNGASEETGVFAAVVDLNSQQATSIFNNWKIDTVEDESDENGNPTQLDPAISMDKPNVDKQTPKKEKTDENGETVTEGGKTVLVEQDTRALLLASTINRGSFYAVSGSYTLEADSLYRLQFSVCSKVENENSGAFVFVRGDMEYDFKCINTNGSWSTYELYIETNRTASMSVKIELWLGYGPGKSTSESYATDGNDKYATRGFALFDNIICKKVVEKDADADKELNFGDLFTKYDSAKSIHNNYLAFVESDEYKALLQTETLSSYYFIDANLANRSHFSSSTYFTSNTYRSYFYGFRDYSSSNLSSSYWSLNSDCNSSSSSSLGSSYYGVVNPANLYKETTEDNGEGGQKTSYNSTYTSITAMDSAEWLADFVNTSENEYDFASLDEQYVLMLYNSSLRASGLTSSKTIKIDANSYYAISVWAYVWGKTYDSSASFNNAESYFKAYSGTKPTDPTSSASSTYSADEKAIYALYLAVNEETPLPTLPKEYFNTASSTTFDGKTFEEQLNAKVIENTNKTVYDQILEAVKSWLTNQQNITSVNTTLAEEFFYTYLYYCYNDDLSVVSSPVVSASVLNEYFDTEEDAQSFFANGFKQEKYNNVNTVNKIKEAYDTYTTELEEYSTAKAAYDTQCQYWETNNPNGPNAKLKLTGAGDGIEVSTDKVGEWQKITVYVQGNQLSARELTVNLLFGEGTDTNKQMIGGVFFDNLEVVAVTENIDSYSWKTLSNISSTDAVNFGGLTLTEGTEPVSDWKATKNSGTADADESLVKCELALDEDIKNVNINGTTYKMWAVNFSNEKATASTLIYEGDKVITILPNKFYRFAFLMKTENIDEDLGIGVSLLKSENVADVTAGESLTSFSAYTANDGWQEVVYYIQGDLEKTWYATVKVTMGSGSRTETDSYVEGKVKMTSFNLLDITYDEYTAAKTGDKITSALSLNSVSNSITKDDISVTNPTYSDIDYSKTSSDEFDKDTGVLTGIGTTANWTAGTQLSNDFSAITLEKDSGNIAFKWTASTASIPDAHGDLQEVSPEKYEIWIKYESNNTTVTKLYDIVPVTNSAQKDYTYSVSTDLTKYKTTHFAVRAVSKDGVSPLTESSYLTFAAESDASGVNPQLQTEEKEYKAQAGTVIIDRESFFGDAINSTAKYSSAYNTLLKISSDYSTAMKMTSSSFTLATDNCYKVSVWAKTDVGTTATIALTSSSGSLIADVDDNLIGYKSITTDGEWKEYCFYVKTAPNFSASLKVNLCLGNPYAPAQEGTKGSDDVTYYNTDDLSCGAVYFDAVRISTVKSATYDTVKAIYATAKEEGNDAVLTADMKKLYKNVDSYIYPLEYSIDSFDASTASSDEDFGSSPNNYSHDYIDGLSTAATASAYGVYDTKSTSGDMENAIKYLYTTADTDTESVFNTYFGSANCADTVLDTTDYTLSDWDAFIQEFLTIKSESGVNGGNNVLVMSNKLKTGYGQSYSLSSSYNYTIATDKYYKFTFTAKTFLAKIVYVDAKDQAKAYYDAGTWSEHCTEFYNNGTQIGSTADYDETVNYTTLSYSMKDAYGELRFTTGETDATPVSVYISSYKEGETVPQAKTYSIYLHNPEKGTSSTASWAFYLGDDTTSIDKALQEKLVGLMAIDLVTMEEIDAETYTAETEVFGTNYDENGKVIDAKASSLKYEYGEAEEEEEEPDDEGEDDTEEEEKSDFWTNLVNDQYFWLYISSFVLGIVIVVVVIVVIVRNFQKKHPKKVVVESNVKTSKEITVVEPEPQMKEDALESDEYTDKIDVSYKQRTVQKKKKKK